MKELQEKIKKKKAVVGILGIGFVGQELGKAIAHSNYSVVGFDIDPNKVNEINDQKIKGFQAYNEFNSLKKCDIIIVSVPTPLKKGEPDLSFLINAANSIRTFLRKGQVIIQESTVAPGTTRDIFLPILEKSDLKVEKDFFLGFSPHRVDFSLEEYTIKNIPKVISGFAKKSLELIDLFYSEIVDKTILVTSMEIAEFCKILENTFRFVNINLINELSEYAIEKGLDIWETIEAAKTKPFGYMPFYPGAGISGHCIPVDPIYLYDDAKKIGIELKILEEASTFHQRRIEKIVKKTFSLLKEKATPPFSILIVGITIKANDPDVRESVGLKIGKKLQNEGAKVYYHDPLISKDSNIYSSALSKSFLKGVDLAIIISEHENIQYQTLIEAQVPIIDTRNVYKKKNKWVHKF